MCKIVKLREEKVKIKQEIVEQVPLLFKKKK